MVYKKSTLLKEGKKKKSDWCLGYQKTKKYFSNSKCIVGYGVERKVYTEDVI